MFLDNGFKVVFYCVLYKTVAQILTLKFQVSKCPNLLQGTILYFKSFPQMFLIFNHWWYNDLILSIGVVETKSYKNF